MAVVGVCSCSDVVDQGKHCLSEELHRGQMLSDVSVSHSLSILTSEDSMYRHILSKEVDSRRRKKAHFHTFKV